MANDIRITLRLPEAVHKVAKAASEEASISLNEQLVTAISEYFGIKNTLLARLEQLEQEVAELKQGYVTGDTA